VGSVPGFPQKSDIHRVKLSQRLRGLDIIVLLFRSVAPFPDVFIVKEWRRENTLSHRIAWRSPAAMGY
jgi:hypothetical protein